MTFCVVRARLPLALGIRPTAHKLLALGAGYFCVKIPLFCPILVKKRTRWGGESPNQPDGRHGLLLNWYLGIGQTRDTFSSLLNPKGKPRKQCNAIITAQLVYLYIGADCWIPDRLLTWCTAVNRLPAVFEMQPPRC